MTTPRVEMNDYAWTWYDQQLDTWIVDCPDCGQYPLPSTASGLDALNMANLHNQQRHTDTKGVTP